MSGSTITVLLLAAGVVIGILGFIYSRLQNSADSLGKRFDKVDEDLVKLRDDLSKTKSAVAFIRGQLTGSAAQRKTRRDAENGDS